MPDGDGVKENEKDWSVSPGQLRERLGENKRVQGKERKFQLGVLPSFADLEPAL